MIELLIAGVVGVLLGAGGAVGFHVVTKDKGPQIIEVGGDKVAQAQVEVQKQLTDLDLLTAPCSSEYIKEQGDLLCREMFCRMQQRGIDAQTSQIDCSEISNIANTRSIRDTCAGLEGDALEKCTDLFFKRK